MAKYIIVGVILLVWAVIEGVSWFWTKKLLDKREEGLDRRKEQLAKKESALTKWERALEEKRKLMEQPVQFETTRMRPERYQCVAILRPGEDTEEDIKRYKEKMTLRLIQDAMENIVFYRKKDDRHLYAEIWICRKETEEE